jgi:hypothetical protein
MRGKAVGLAGQSADQAVLAHISHQVSRGFFRSHDYRGSPGRQLPSLLRPCRFVVPRGLTLPWRYGGSRKKRLYLRHQILLKKRLLQEFQAGGVNPQIEQSVLLVT